MPDAGSAKQFPAAFSMAAGQTGDPIALGTNWAVYRVAQHDPVNQDDYDKQKAKLEETFFSKSAKRPSICSAPRSERACNRKANCR